jgi:hypothetical protein
MRRNFLLMCLFVALYLEHPSRAAEPLSDGQIFYMVVGSWIADPTHLDALAPSAVEEERHAIATYSPDGTAIVTVYSDVTCKAIVRSMQFYWGIKGGIMIAKSAEGLASSQDEVITIDKKTMTLRLVGGSPREVGQTMGIVEHRVRASNCATPE